MNQNEWKFMLGRSAKYSSSQNNGQGINFFAFRRSERRRRMKVDM